jgi:hypothetical protein
MTTTKTERETRADALCRQLTADVVAIAPPGLGGWLPDKHPARTASGDFLDTLAAWERGEATVDQVREAYDQTLEAWRQAAEVFRAETDQAMGGTV